MSVITLSREKGSGGQSIAKQAAEKLSYSVVDKSLIIDVARELGVSEAAVERFDEHEPRKPGIGDWLRDVFMGTDPVFSAEAAPVFWPTQTMPTLVPTPPVQGEHILDRIEYLDVLRQLIRRIHHRGDAIIVGRGGQAILKNETDVLHVRIIAPLEIRCERVMAREKIGLEEARKGILVSDRARAEYLHEHFGMNWADPAMYHLTINTGLCSIKRASEMVLAAVPV
ncbi:MAG: cytidylate kinase-like family protein [Candidatus Latescibacteria bacterium]|jgi:CMP/dCMP kinase|nr:cytidylate kinase-like family protein [Candidatus Latescibacterota bacterium]